MEVVIMKSAITDTRKLGVVVGLSGFLVILLFLASSSINPFSVDDSVLELSTTAAAATSSSSSSSPSSWVNIIRPVEHQTVDSPTSNNATSSINDGLNTSRINEEENDNNNSSTATATSSSPIKVNVTYPPPPAPSPSHSAITSSEALNPEPPVLSEDDDVAAADFVLEDNKKKKENCNIFEGRWVYKPSEKMTYTADECPFLDVGTTCQKNGRPDADYEGWSWQPFDCDLPLFNGKDMLERLRGKRVMIAGDSLNRNQWESLACLLYTSIPDPSRALITRSGSDKVLKALDYDFSLEFYWCPFLVDVEIEKNGRRILHLNKLVPSSKKWRGAEVMVFNSAHWWSHGVQIRAWDVFEYEGKVMEEMPKEVAYERGLTTWSRWISKNVNPNKTRVFYRSVSPVHFGKHWCFNASGPLDEDSFSSYASSVHSSMMNVLETHISGMDINVRYLNITWLSGYRRDAHPSVYMQEESKWKAALLLSVPHDETTTTSTLEILAKRHSDCSHWCLPGVPDTWNRLLYASLFFF